MMLVMDDGEILVCARAFGFALVSERVSGARVWGWRQDGEDRRPRFPTRRQALAYMQDRLTRLAGSTPASE